jgi:hypothetical protein
VAELLPAGGIALLLASVILYLLNANRADRVEHRKERQEWDQRYRDLDTTASEKIRALDAQVDQLEKELRTQTLRADRAEAKLEGHAEGTLEARQARQERT